jgi:hypothetical protein
MPNCHKLSKKTPKIADSYSIKIDKFPVKELGVSIATRKLLKTIYFGNKK